MLSNAIVEFLVLRTLLLKIPAFDWNFFFFLCLLFRWCSFFLFFFRNSSFPTIAYVVAIVPLIKIILLSVSYWLLQNTITERHIRYLQRSIFNFVSLFILVNATVRWGRIFLNQFKSCFFETLNYEIYDLYIRLRLDN